MAREASKELKGLIGKLPDGWDKMSLEEKIWQVDHKWRLLSTDDMYDLEISFGFKSFRDDEKSVGACFALVPDGDHQFTDGGSCFAIPNPAANGQVNKSKFPKYLRGFIDECALTDWETDKSLTCALYSSICADTFEEGAEKMFFFLDLLTYGYELTEIEWYEEKHPDLFPNHDKDDEDLDDED